MAVRVLILVVMDDPLRDVKKFLTGLDDKVLILVVMDDPLRVLERSTYYHEDVES